MKLLATAIALILIIPFAVLSLAVYAVAFGVCWARESCGSGEKQAMRDDIDRLMQREWDLTMQLNAVTQAERRLNRAPAVNR